MFETNQYERERQAHPPAIPAQPFRVSDNIAKMSWLFWSEHCVECSAPACYTTCDLYETRPDGRCRRFTFGIAKNRAFSSVRGYGAEISFKKWGVMVARGNTYMEPVSRLRWKERLADAGALVLNRMGRAVSFLTGDRRWKHATHSAALKFATFLHRIDQTRTNPDAFLLEIYNPTPSTITLQLAMQLSPQARGKLTTIGAVPPQFNMILSIPHGYSKHEFESRLFRSILDAGAPFDIALMPEADSAAHLVLLTADFVTYQQQLATSKKPVQVKCVVWDLDNTLWAGTLIEDENVRLAAAIPKILETLDGRGILLSIVSKNNFDSAWAKVEQFGLHEYFLYPQINWAPKSQNLRAIAKSLSIGLDTIAFIDDSPFELKEVAATLPEVICIDATAIGTLTEDPRLKGSTSAEAKQRRQFYKEAIAREEWRAEFGADYRQFLTYCDIHLTITPYQMEHGGRIAELVQRTNQLNFSGHKYSRPDLAPILEDQTLDKYVIQCGDRFGSYGIVGFAIVRDTRDSLHIRDFMLSCRVQGKWIEAAFFTHLFFRHNPQRHNLWINFRPTDRNAPARQVLESLGAKMGTDQPGVNLDFSATLPDCSFIAINCSCDDGSHTG